MARVSRRLSFHVYADTDSHAHADTGAARAPAPTVTNVTGSHVDAIQLVWNTEAGVTRYQVQYRVQGVDEPWILGSNQIVSPRGQPEVVHEIDSLSDCSTTFEIEVRGKGNGVDYDFDNFGDPTLETGQVACPFVLGMQSDHTVSWEIGSRPGPNPIPPPPEDVANPDTVFVSGIPLGENAWDGVVTGVSICNPCTANDDDAAVTIWADYDNSCGEAIACVDNIQTHIVDDHDINHIANMDMFIEHGSEENGYDIWWTRSSGLDNTFVPRTNNMAEFYYIGAIFAHEFGHTLGIDDLNDHADFDSFTAVMNNFHNKFTPTDHDRLHLEAIYRGHTPHPTPTP